MPSKLNHENDRLFETQGGHFAYVVKSHMKNAAKSITRAIFAYTAFTPFRVGMGELTSFPWRNGGQITAYRWYRQRAEKSYFFLSLRIAQIETHCNKKSTALQVQTDVDWSNIFDPPTPTAFFSKAAFVVCSLSLPI